MAWDCESAGRVATKSDESDSTTVGLLSVPSHETAKSPEDSRSQGMFLSAIGLWNCFDRIQHSSPALFRSRHILDAPRDKPEAPASERRVARGSLAGASGLWQITVHQRWFVRVFLAQPQSLNRNSSLVKLIAAVTFISNDCLSLHFEYGMVAVTNVPD